MTSNHHAPYVLGYTRARITSYNVCYTKLLRYFIFHNESGNFVEYSVRTISPYLAKRDSLYYSGPGQYFYYDQQTTIDLITGNKLTEQDIILEQEESKKIQDLLVENTNKNVSDYIRITSYNVCYTKLLRRCVHS